jgi:UDP-GlcNAc:undecaprenyl-phosphate GlcNAc-1-phosphate transferase
MLTLFWIVGITNAFNLLDGIDGLAAGAALFATMALLGSAVILHQGAAALILAAVAGATAAFLRYNFNPASIFLGDSGSLFLGFTISVLAVQSSQKSAAAFAVAVPIVSLGVPVLDTCIVVFRRMVSGEPVWTGDRRHIHHILLDRGLSVRQVAIGMYAVCGALALISLIVASPSAPLVGPVLVMLGIGVGLAMQQLRIPELRALSTHVVRSLQRQRPLLMSAAVVEKMLVDLERAPDVGQRLRVLARALAGSGFVTARLVLPAQVEVPRDVPEWAVSEAESTGCGRTWRWMAKEAPNVKRLITLDVPLTIGGDAGTLSISAEADDRHQASLINWLGREVAEAIGTSLGRGTSNKL